MCMKGLKCTLKVFEQCFDYGKGVRTLRVCKLSFLYLDNFIPLSEQQQPHIYPQFQYFSKLNVSFNCCNSGAIRTQLVLVLASFSNYMQQGTYFDVILNMQMLHIVQGQWPFWYEIFKWVLRMVVLVVLDKHCVSYN